MALATRCPNCHTTFRVVQDQLKLYSGIVRCGVCQEVFNGADYLLKEESPTETAAVSATSDSPAQLAADPVPVPDNGETDELSAELRDMLEKVRNWNGSKDAIQHPIFPAAARPAVSAENTALPESVYQPPKDDDEFAPTELNAGDYADLDALELQAAHEELPVIELNLEESEKSTASAHHELELDLTLPASDEAEHDALEPDSPQPDPDLPEWSDNVSESDSDEPLQTSLELQPELPAYNQAAIDTYLDGPDSNKPENEPYLDASLPAAAPAAEPQFVKKAKSRRKARLLTRILLSICSLLLLAALALQSIYAFHERIVARMPSARPIVSAVCDILDCETRVSARIDELSLESTELQNLPNRPNTFVLDIVLRNRSSSAQAWPNLELTLNDESGQPALRRVLSPAEYLVETHNDSDIEKGIAAESEKTLKLVFTLDKAKAAGYRVYLFYP